MFSRKSLLTFAVALTIFSFGFKAPAQSIILTAQTAAPTDSAAISKLTRPIVVVNNESSSHVQGIAVDLAHQCIYFSFTTKLLKTDLEGNLLGSVRGFSCHLGCLELDRETGKLYASVEYLDDEIGQGISGSAATQRENSFYIGIFDTKKITATDMDAESSGVFTTVYLPQVVADYEDSVYNQGVRVPHRYGCAGFDGLSMGPQFGKADGNKYLNIAYGVYANKNRTDNDYQILLQYSLDSLEKYALPLNQAKPHHSGPAEPLNRFFIYTGNTSYGVQNLEYDPATNLWFLCVYPGSKSSFPNYCIFAVDGAQSPSIGKLSGMDSGEEGQVLPLAAEGQLHAASGVRGWPQYAGSTGIESLGYGYFFIATGASQDGLQSATVRLYRWTPSNTSNPFQLVN